MKIFHKTDQLIEDFSLEQRNREFPLKKNQIDKFKFVQLSLKAAIG